MIEITQADARKLPLPDNSVQMCVTSPPYWGLRAYSGEQEVVWEPSERRPADPFICIEEGHVWGDPIKVNATNHTDSKRWNHTRNGRDELQPPEKRVAWLRTEVDQGNVCQRCGAWRGAFGLEPTYGMYVEHMVIVLREIRRVLRPDGVLFLNIGDCYATGGGKVGLHPGGGTQGERWSGHRGQHKDGNSGMQDYIYGGIGPMTQPNRMPQAGLKPKDLSMIPARVALAAQADGWWLRSDIIWQKPNPMPESVTDRPTDSYEHIFMLTKSEQYFWDSDPVREVTSGGAHARRTDGKRDGTGTKVDSAIRGTHEGWEDTYQPSSRNVRNVWTFATQPYNGAHFATFPEELPRRCILAATSVKGACAQCGAPWERITRAKFYGDWNPGPGSNGHLKVNAQTDVAIKRFQGKNAILDDQENASRMLTSLKAKREAGAEHDAPYEAPVTIGWAPTCLCKGQHGKTVPCVVLDPFGGSGTTGRVAAELQRRAYLFDIAYGTGGYEELAKKRTTNVQMSLTNLQ